MSSLTSYPSLLLLHYLYNVFIFSSNLMHFWTISSLVILSFLLANSISYKVIVSLFQFLQHHYLNQILILTLYNTDCLIMIVTLFKIEGCHFVLLFLVGLSIAPLSVSDRKEVMSIAHRWCLEDFDVVAFAYTPVHNSVRTISSHVYRTVLKKNPT